jgi:integrase
MAYAEKVYKVRGGKQTTKYTWRARYKKPDGTWGSEPGFPTKGTAEKWGEEQEAAMRAGRWIDPSLSRKTFGDFAEQWMAAQKPRGQTVMNRRERLTQTILPRWRDTPLIDITWFEVEAWARGLSCAHVTTKICVRLMSQILGGAVDARYLAVNPLQGRRLGGLPADTARRRKTEHEDMWARPEEVLQMARRMGPVDGLLVLSMAFLGLRVEEALGLHRRNTLLTRRQQHDDGVFTCPVIRIDADQGALVEYYKYGDDGRRIKFRGLEPPKNPQSARDIDVPPFLVSLLEERLADWPHEFVFARTDGSWWPRGTLLPIIRKVADGRQPAANAGGRSRVEPWEPIKPGLSMRDLRHSHDTYQAQIGVKPVLAFEQAGHKYPGIKGTYQHATPAMRQERLDGLQALYLRALGNLGWESTWES